MHTSALPACGDVGALNEAVIYLLVLFIGAQPLNSAPARMMEHNPNNLTVSLVFFMLWSLAMDWLYKPSCRKNYSPFVIDARAD